MGIQKSWAWVSDRSLSPGNEGSLEGYEFDPNAMYKRVAFRDGDDNGSLDDNDLPGAHTNDGVTIDGFTYNVKHHWTFNATIHYRDGTQIQIKIMVMRLWDDPDIQGKGPYHGRLLFRAHDDTIDRIFEGVDGPEGKDYPMKDIIKIVIGKFINSVNGRSMDALRKEIPVCFCRGTLIETSCGSVRIERLLVGNLVKTLGNGLQPIRWIGTWKLTASELKHSPHLRPILIQADALGKGKPGRDLMVSPQHRILVRSRIAKRMFGASEILVAAKHLLEIKNIDYSEAIGDIMYFHILFDQHEIIFANGAETESLYLGTQAIRSINPVNRQEISKLFPFGMTQDRIERCAPARLLISGRMGRRLAFQHSKNDCRLVS